MPSLRRLAFAALASTLPLASAQSCISLQGSTQCSAFNASSISTDKNLTDLFPFLSFVSSVQQFDQQLSQYVNSSYIQTKYEQLIGCDNINLTNTTNYYARFTTSVICNSIVQNSIKPCNLSGSSSTPLCADSCAQQAITEEEIAASAQLCSNPNSDFITQVRADFTNCALPSDSLSGKCINAALNEPANCGFSTNLQGLCRYCSAPANATDNCCYTSNVTSRCANVSLPALGSMPTLFPSSTPPPSTSSAAPAPNNGLSSGAIAGIVIGSIVGLALLIGLIFLCCICLRRRNRGSANGSLNQPSPLRNNRAMDSAGGASIAPIAGGRVARMTALEGSSSSEKGGRPSSSDGAYGSSPEAHGAGGMYNSRGLHHPPTSQRRGSLSSGSAFAALGAGSGGEETTSPSNAQMSSPEGGVQSGQSEQLPYFKDYYSSDEIRVGDSVACLWAYQPRAQDEFELERGDMLRVVGIWDDGWATGVRLRERAEEWDGSGGGFHGKWRVERDSGVSNGTVGQQKEGEMGRGGLGTREGDGEGGEFGEIKAFPLVCVCLPEHWRKTIEADDNGGYGGGGGGGGGIGRGDDGEGHFGNF